MNTASGPADWLGGSFTADGPAPFSNALTNVSGVGAGQSDAAGTVTLAAGTAGTFTETITFAATGSNASGYSGALPGQTLTITGTVAADANAVVTATTATPPVISGTRAGQITLSDAPVMPFGAVTITDPNQAADTLLISLSGAGTLVGDGLTGGNGVYRLSGTAAAITAALDALVFIPAAGAPVSSNATSFTLSDQSSASATPAIDNVTSVIDNDPRDLFIDYAPPDQTSTEALLTAAYTSLQGVPVAVGTASGATLRLPPVTPSTIGVASIIGASSGLVTLLTGYGVLTNIDSAPVTVIGNGGTNEYIGSGSTGGFTFNSRGGTGTVVAGGGNNLVGSPTVGSNAYIYTVDGPNDTVTAFTGTNTVNAVGNNALIGTGTANDLINISSLNDTVVLGTGAITVTVSVGGVGLVGAVDQFGRPTNAKLTFINASALNSTIFGGAGSDTIRGGTGGVFVGGTGGDNVITTGSGATTVFAGGNNDLISVVGSGSDQINAASGNETLSALTAAGNNVFNAGAGQTTVIASTVTGAVNVFSFNAGQTSGGTETIFNFTSSDTISTTGYGAAPTVTSTPGGSTIVLSDQTRITVFGVTPTLKVS